MSQHVDAAKIEQQLLAIREGLREVLKNGRTMPYRQTTYDLAGLLQVVDALLEPYLMVKADRLLLTNDVAKRRSKAPSAKGFVKAFRTAALAHYEEGSQEFAAFGFTPEKKPRHLTPEEQELKVERARATRTARKTVGPRAREKIRGVVEPPPEQA